MPFNDVGIDKGLTLKSWSKLSLENDTLNQSPCMSVCVFTLMQRHSEKGMVTTMSRTERAVNRKAAIPGPSGSAAA